MRLRASAPGAAERPHRDHRHPELVGEREQPLLACTLPRVERHLQHLKASRLERDGELVEG